MITKAADCLQKFTRTADVGAVVENILYNVLIGNYDETIVLINALLQSQSMTTA
jgi:hypothetical protein